MASPNPHLIIALFHIFLVVPFLLYIGIQRSSVPVWIYWICLVLGILLLVYHGAKTVLKLMQNIPSYWVNIIHALFLAPLLIYLGWKKYDSSRPAYEVLLLFTFGALGYHFLTIVNLVQEGSALLR